MVGLLVQVSEVSNAIYIKLFNEYCESVFAACDTVVSAKCLVNSIDGAMHGLAIPVLEKATHELHSLRQMADQRTFCVNKKQVPRLGFLEDLESLLPTVSPTSNADTAFVNCTSELVWLCRKMALQSQLVYSFCVNSLKDPVLSHIEVLLSALICSLIEEAPASRLQDECRMLVERLRFVEYKRVAGYHLPKEVMTLLNAVLLQLAANSPHLRDVAESICRAREMFRKSVFQQLPYEMRFEFDSLSKTVLPDQNITLAIVSARCCDTVA